MPQGTMTMSADEFLALNRELEELKTKADPTPVPPQIIYKKSDFPWWLWLGLGVLGGLLIATMNTKPQDKPGFGLPPDPGPSGTLGTGPTGNPPTGPDGNPPTGPGGNPPTPPATPPATQRKPNDPAPDTLPPRPDAGVAPALPPKQASSTHFEVKPEFAEPVIVDR